MIIVFKYCIATMILLFKSIAKYCNLYFWNEMKYRTCKLNSLEKQGSGDKSKVPLHPLNSFSNFF